VNFIISSLTTYPKSLLYAKIIVRRCRN